MRKRQDPLIRRARINNKKLRKGRQFKGMFVTPANRSDLIYEKTLEIIDSGTDPDTAFIVARRFIRREQKHLKAFLKGQKTYTFGKDDKGNAEVFHVL